MIKIAPSILSADINNLASEFKNLSDAGIDTLHMDIMDGSFVPNITFGFSQLKQMRKATNALFDTHLMIVSPDRYIKDFIDSGSDIVTVHQEACVHLQRTLSLIKSYGAKAGVALNPATPLSTLEYVLDDIDLILIMSVNPGFGGQKFIPAMMDKIIKAKSFIGERDILLEVDGGINLSNARQVCDAGADMLVSGSYIFKGNIKENVRNMYMEIKGGH